MPEPLPYASGDIDAGSPVEATLAQKISWIMIDWANSGYGLTIITAVFPPFFIRALLPQVDGQAQLLIAGVRVPGDAVWGLLTALSMALMAVAAPVLGAVADIRGWTKRLLIIHTLLGGALTTTLYFLAPGQWVAGSVIYVLSNYCFGASYAFFNAYLPRLARPEKQGSLSGWGFAAGYIGGALSLVISLWLIKRDQLALGVALPGLWWIIFSIPAFILLKEFAPQQPGFRGSMLRAGFGRVADTLRNLRQFKVLFVFLLAFLLYNDGVETVIAMASPFGTQVLRMTQDQLIIMLLIVQAIAFVGAVIFGYLSDRIGNKNVIIINLAIWVLAATLAIFVRTPHQFTLLGVMVGLVLGGVQAASRALMSLLAPPGIVNEAFGFFSISGKFASIFGPLLYALTATLFSSRLAILSVLPFLVGGMLLVLRVREPTRT